MKRFPFIVIAYIPLVYLLILLPLYLYEPTKEFTLPNLLWLSHLIFLYIHEAGHLFFSFFGNTVMLMGGSLMQILAPLAWFFAAQRESSKLKLVALFFTGVSIADVSIYVKDAGMPVLPLLGGLRKTHHDWANLFNSWGVIEYSYSVGELLFWIGFVLAAYSLFALIASDFKQKRIE